VSAPHDGPDPATLLDAVQEFLATEIEPELSGRLRYHLKVAVNVLRIAERELRFGDEHAARHAARLARLGFADDAALAAAIRCGSVDARLDEIEAELRAAVADKLAVARPGYGGSVTE
jgi:Domain of unknown function (DUF6285)